MGKKRARHTLPLPSFLQPPDHAPFIASAVNILDVEAVILGGGLGIRFGQPMAERISKAMAPHLFNDQPSPDVHVAALGDLGGAIGAALLARPPRPERPAPARRVNAD